MRPILFVFISFFVLSASAQNIVPNPSFSIYSTCPDNVGELYYATGWNTPIQSTPDYFNSCSSNANVNVPKNLAGYQSSPSLSYAGLGAYSTSAPDIREYIKTNIPPLETGAIYKVTILVSLADFSHSACDAIGVFFYKDATPDTDLYFAPIPATPQIDFTSYGIISDTVNWVTLSKTFVADSAYTHLVIGNFKPDVSLHITSFPSGLIAAAYYYIDSVSVEKIHPAFVANSEQNTTSTISPNPFTTHTTLFFNNLYHHPHQLSVYNIQGALVRQVDNITASEITIQRDQLEKGIYFYQLCGPDNTVMRGKMIVQ